eukprot:CAMPEP_0194083702 /NCGR_PEP_ID=MMETSP0149-20130528/9714_1 /TAXON_ID=122233 /ORGANISM="Chaetoceros debilis, Strain MM31A-1" /LENGTH=301 /DNA_ID=CAMNT_0038766153 /DNA_START=114 /DNA_END=1022 /DNA_ORIENTATION=-
MKVRNRRTSSLAALGKKMTNSLAVRGTACSRGTERMVWIGILFVIVMFGWTADFDMNPYELPKNVEAVTSSGMKQVASSDPSKPWHEQERPVLTNFPSIGRRLEFLHHLEKLPHFRTGIEVGVQKGILAKKSLDIWQSCTEYVLVDLWGKEEGYSEPGADNTADKNNNLREARNRMRKWEASKKVKFMVMRSTDAAKHLPDGHFDYIYLDARHDYCAVKEDIEAYYPKLRPGGILGGHDYIDAQYAIDRLGEVEDWSKCEDGSVHPEAVKGSVDDFRKQQGGLPVYVSNEDFPSWYIQKPY